MIDATRPGCELEVDGGIDHETAPLVVEAGRDGAGRRHVDLRFPDGVAWAMEVLRGGLDGFLADPTPLR